MLENVCLLVINGVDRQPFQRFSPLFILWHLSRFTPTRTNHPSSLIPGWIESWPRMINGNTRSNTLLSSFDFLYFIELYHCCNNFFLTWMINSNTRSNTLLFSFDFLYFIELYHCYNNFFLIWMINGNTRSNTLLSSFDFLYFIELYHCCNNFFYSIELLNKFPLT